MSPKIYQIQIALKGITPKIWRRILVSSDTSVADFHKIIQSTMGWDNSHLHQFIKNRTFYSQKMEDDDFWDEMDNVDYTDMNISDLLTLEKEKIIYEYDFGDGWEHDVILEKIVPLDKKLDYPVCVKGEMCCPPEDCGGPWGYPEMLAILKDPKNEEYEGYMEWLGGEFDPEEFDIDDVNELLQMEDFGCDSFF